MSNARGIFKTDNKAFIYQCGHYVKNLLVHSKNGLNDKDWTPMIWLVDRCNQITLCRYCHGNDVNEWNNLNKTKIWIILPYTAEQVFAQSLKYLNIICYWYFDIIFNRASNKITFPYTFSWNFSQLWSCVWKSSLRK